MPDFTSLRERYPRFIYDSYQTIIRDDCIEAEFLFQTEGLSRFEVHWTFPVRQRAVELKNNATFEQLVFCLGMVELISYWKPTCSPEVVIKAGYLSPQQIDWWKKLYYQGLGEFFYTNNIKTDLNSFMNISAKGSKAKGYFRTLPEPKGTLIPIGGGKDSAVTLELLKETKSRNLCYIINPRQASLETCRVGGYSDRTLVAHRTLDERMLELNRQGFLNGHTPFSAIVAFSSVITAYINNLRYVALSNESSANEATVKNSDINHQYSKSFEFEVDFNSYEKSYINSGVYYFSLLRPLNELQIASVFSRLDKYHGIFKSCNAGSKADIWCCHCPKCLFVYIILSPFLEQGRLREIFGANLLDDEGLTGIFDKLIGVEEEKPFECVGSRQEINAALCMSIDKIAGSGNPLPRLLRYYKTLGYYESCKDEAEWHLRFFDEENLLPDSFRKVIEKECLPEAF